MTIKIEDCLHIVGELESFSPSGDRFSNAVSETADFELTEDDLSLVAAAAKPVPFQEFLRQYNEQL